jgi:hypothetical protein
MAVTTQDSTQLAAQLTGTQPALEAHAFYGKLRALPFNFTQSGVGDANSIVRLLKMPAGKHTILWGLSRLRVSALGAGRTLDLGYAAHYDPAGAAVAGDEDAFASAIDVSAAAVIVFDETGNDLVTSMNAKVEVDTIPNAATIDGYIVIAVE